MKEKILRAISEIGGEAELIKKTLSQVSWGGFGGYAFFNAKTSDIEIHSLSGNSIPQNIDDLVLVYQISPNAKSDFLDEDIFSPEELEKKRRYEDEVDFQNAMFEKVSEQERILNALIFYGVEEGGILKNIEQIEQ